MKCNTLDSMNESCMLDAIAKQFGVCRQWGSYPRSLARAVVDLISNRVEMLLAVSAQVRALWHVLAQQAIHVLPSSTCAMKKVAPFLRVRIPPGDFAPAGSNRSSHGGNEVAEAFGVEGHLVTWRVCRPQRE